MTQQTSSTPNGQRISVAGLQVDSALYALVNEHIAPGTGVDAEGFWASFGAVVNEFAPRNRTLLAKRDALQAAIDQWHLEHRNSGGDARNNFAAYKAFLQELDYLVSVG